ncbi:MAG: hypothetical protein BWZ10_02099 [candidate division BRC1 bacterium ADurb.BinA364]|nr:MAG: hypothetical protein BWZ10_02099 [candidate division BRC1 bacterium ADurb.BinA364]
MRHADEQIGGKAATEPEVGGRSVGQTVAGEYGRGRLGESIAVARLRLGVRGPKPQVQKMLGEAVEGIRSGKTLQLRAVGVLPAPLPVERVVAVHLNDRFGAQQAAQLAQKDLAAQAEAVDAAQIAVVRLAIVVDVHRRQLRIAPSPARDIELDSVGPVLLDAIGDDAREPLGPGQAVRTASRTVEAQIDLPLIGPEHHVGRDRRPAGFEGARPAAPGAALRLQLGAFDFVHDQIFGAVPVGAVPLVKRVDDDGEGKRPPRSGERRRIAQNALRLLDAHPRIRFRDAPRKQRARLVEPVPRPALLDSVGRHASAPGVLQRNDRIRPSFSDGAGFRGQAARRMNPVEALVRLQKRVEFRVARIQGGKGFEGHQNRKVLRRLEGARAQALR